MKPGMPSKIGEHFACIGPNCGYLLPKDCVVCTKCGTINPDENGWTVETWKREGYTHE